MILRWLRRLLIKPPPKWTRQRALDRLRQLSRANGIVSVIYAQEHSYLFNQTPASYLTIKGATALVEDNPFYLVSYGVRTPPRVLTLGALRCRPLDEVYRCVVAWGAGALFDGDGVKEMFPRLLAPLDKAYEQLHWIQQHWSQYQKTGCLPADLE